MAEPSSYRDNVTPITQRLQEAPKIPPLQSSGGGGTYDGMEGRVAALEKAFERQDAKLDAILKDVSYLRGKIEGMPTTLQLLGFIIAVLAIAGLAKYFAP